MTFTYDGDGMGKGGAVTIAANDKVVAKGRVERTVPFRFSTEETFDVGEDTGTPVDLSYDRPQNSRGPGQGRDRSKIGFARLAQKAFDPLHG